MADRPARWPIAGLDVPPCLALALPCLAWPRLAVPGLALPLSLADLMGLASHRLPLLCFASQCFASQCLELLCFAVLCFALLLGFGLLALLACPQGKLPQAKGESPPKTLVMISDSFLVCRFGWLPASGRFPFFRANPLIRRRFA